MVDKKTIREWCRSSNYRPTFYGDDPSIVILGEKHGTPKHRQKEEEMIRPEYLLTELLDVRTYNPQTKEEKFLPGVPIDEFDRMNLEGGIEDYMVKWSEKYGLFLVGMDLSYAEMGLVIDNLYAEHPNYEFTSQSPKVCLYREKRMGERMAEYKQKTARTIVAIMGDYHRRPKSGIHPILQKKGISYVCIPQP